MTQDDRLAKRIAQFEQLCQDDPGNDMAHFSLAGAYAQAGRHEDAARSYMRAIEANEGLSKAYQLAGASLSAAGKNDEAVEILRRGYVVAAGRGDLMPKNAMAELIRGLGGEVPEVETTDAGPAPDGSFIDSVSGKPGTKMTRPPFRGGVGAWIQENVSKQTFDEWIGMGTKIINELKLDLSRDEHDAVYDYGMRLYLGITDEIYRRVTDGQEPPQPDPQYRDVIDQIVGQGRDLEAFQGQLHSKLE